MKLKGIDGDPHKQRSMWFNSRLREEPYQDLTYQGKFLEIKTLDLSTLDTGGAWLSSARVVRCWVKSRNERNPYLQLPAFWMGTLERLPMINRRKVGMTSNHHALYVLGYTRATMVGTKRSEIAISSKPQKTDPSSD